MKVENGYVFASANELSVRDEFCSVSNKEELHQRAEELGWQYSAIKRKFYRPVENQSTDLIVNTDFYTVAGRFAGHCTVSINDVSPTGIVQAVVDNQTLFKTDEWLGDYYVVIHNLAGISDRINKLLLPQVFKVRKRSDNNA